MKPINIFVKYTVNYKIDFFVSDSVDFVQNLLRLNRERRRKGQNSKKEAFKNSLSSRRRSCIDASGH